jgi:hypothetical protein
MESDITIVRDTMGWIETFLVSQGKEILPWIDDGRDSCP